MSKVWLALIGCMVLIGTFMIFQKSNADDPVARCIYQIGSVKIISLLDGHIDLPIKNIVRDDTDFDHPYFHAQPNETMQVPINVFLVDTGAQIILVDVGLAGMYHSKTGLLMQALQQAGYSADQINAVLITHLHPDHIAGLLDADGTKAFKYADLYVAQSEVDYWLHTEEHPSIITLVQKTFALYAVHTFAPDQQLFDGITVYASPGHTPGHVGFLCNTGQQKLLIWGDIIHVPLLQFAHPGISLLDDTDSTQAIAMRKQILKQATQEKLIIAGIHLVSPGVGTIEVMQDSITDQPSYRWMPMKPTC